MHYLSQLRKDKKLATILAEPLPALTKRKNVPLRLMASIMSQQLSTKVARVIYHRFLAIFDGKEPLPAEVLAVPTETLRNVGLSNAKVGYVQNVAMFCMAQQITDDTLDAMDNEAIIALLTQIKGVGKWTVEMLLMFTLGRADVFAVDDLGIQQAMIRLYRLPADDKKKLKEKMLKLSLKWSPYRTYACMHLWGWKDNPPEL